MKPKKNPAKDLRTKRAIFFEIGLVVALATAIVSFSLGQQNKIVEGLGVVTDLPEVFELPDVIKDKLEDVKTTVKVIPMGDFISVVDNDSRIDPGQFVWPDVDDEVVIPGLEPFEEEVVEDVLDRAERMPTFMGGDLMTFRNWVFERLRYPQTALETEIQGRVIMQFVIEKDGTLSNITILQSPDKLLSEEAVRVVSQSPQWSPAFMGTSPVRLRYTLPVDFRINK